MDANTLHAPIQAEIVQSNEQAEKRLRDIITPQLRLKGNTEDFLKNKLIIKQVERNVFILGTNRIVSAFYDEKSDVILNLNSLRRAYYFQKAGYLAGYREIPSDTQPVNLYHIKDIDDKGNPLSGAKPIDKFSREYYKAFMDIAFYDDRLMIESYKKPMTDGKFGEMDDELLLMFSESSMRIRDLVQMKRQGQVTEKGYKSALAILQKNLLNTIGDYRFERVNQGVRREELDSYLKDGLIDQALHTQATQKLERVEKIKRALGEKHSEITCQTQIKTAELMNTNNEKIA